MKKLYLLLSVAFVVLTFTSCDFIKNSTESNTTKDTTITTETTTINSTSISTDLTVSTDAKTTETTKVPTTETTKVPTTETTKVPTTDTSTTTEENPRPEPFRLTDYTNLQDAMPEMGIPSTGSPKVLVFAVDFSDYPSSEYGVPVSDLETVFNGTSEAMDFESLNSFYQKSSFNKLDLTADIYGYYRASHAASYYEDEYNKLWATDPLTGDYLYGADEVTYVESDIIYEVLSAYDAEIDYNDYDYNDDGLIDGIYIVYTHPVSFSSGSDLWWAYQAWYDYEGTSFDGVDPLYYCWSGSDFITEGTGTLDARTLIHESGHMMGLDDYYDYSDKDSYNMGGLAGADMMDSAYGDHGPFSKLLLGWIEPIVVQGDATIDLMPYALNGETVLIINEWNDTIFDEYILVSFYTPEGLYEADQWAYFSQTGVMVYHVSAEIGEGFDPDSYYYTIFNYNNTDTEHKVVKFIEADMDNSVENRNVIETADLFQSGDILGDNVYKNYRWYNDEYLGFDLSIVSKDSTKVVIKIDFN